MNQTLTICLLLLIGLNSCAQQSDSIAIKNSSDFLEIEPVVVQKNHIIPNGTFLKTRIDTPTNFNRIKADSNSFATYLRHLPMKPHGSEVMYYDGTYKPNYDVYDAVIDLKIGKRNLHQCADAVMRLWAEYLWTHKRYDEIHFNFTNGFRIDYTKWMQGYRVAIKGSKTSWVKRTSPSNTYKYFWKYMEIVFSYAGTLSLSKELVQVPLDDMQIGDVFIWGGSPGHAILVTDMAINPKTNEKIFLLSQSYMPAQDTQILKNPNNSNLSPWYSLSDLKTDPIAIGLKTPEWVFNVNDLKRFK